MVWFNAHNGTMLYVICKSLLPTLYEYVALNTQDQINRLGQ